MLELDLNIALPQLQLKVTQQLPLAGITALFGPSGGGKTTLLRAIAGLQAARGQVRVADQVWLDSDAGVNLPAFRRPCGFMFQDDRLFPHLNVLGNLRFAESRAPHQAAFPSSLDEVVAALDLDGLLQRRVQGLSGGERQRVALGRTVLTRPALLLLDEPLSALDVERKSEILPYLLTLPRQLGLPTIYVSHSVEEVALLADRTLVLADGRIRAFGDTAEILQRLDLQALTGQFEASSILATSVARQDREYCLTELDVDGQSLTMPLDEALAPGVPVRVRIRARDVALATRPPEHLSIRNVLEAEIVELIEDSTSAFAELLLQVGAQRLRCRVTRLAVKSLELVEGQRVYALIKSVTVDRHAP